MQLRRIAHGALVSTLFAVTWTTAASAQGVELPTPAGARTIVGVVTDTDRRPLEDVEVRIAKLNRSVRTGRNGSFRFDSLPSGKHELRARRLGFEPQTRSVSPKETGAAVLFSLKPLPQALTTVITAATRGGLSGLVTDSMLRPLPGATVHVFGGSARTVTDSAGEFYMDVKSGSFMVRVTSPKHRERRVSVTIPKDSGRYMEIGLVRGKKTSAREEIAMREFAHRLAWRNRTASFQPRENLEKVPNKRLTAVVRSINITGPFDEGLCQAVVNGGPDRVPLWYYDADEIEALEVYPGDPKARPTDVKACPGVYIWLR